MPETSSSHSTFRGNERKYPETEPREATPHGGADQEAIACLKCQLRNPRSHRFCRQCGSMLQKACPKCRTQRPMDEAFCAACGANIRSAEEEMLKASQKKLADVRQMITRLELNDALRILSDLVRQEHPNLEEVRSAAQALIPEVQAERDRHEQGASVHMGRARVLLEELRFHEAMEELNRIPAPLRDDKSRRLLERASTAAREVQDLKQCLQQREGVTLADRMAALRKLLELQPHDPKVAHWAKRVHDQILHVAHEKIRACRYQEAVDLLHSVPESIQSSNFQKLARQADELAYLDSELQLAPTVDRVSLEAAQRLIRLDEGNQTASAALQEMQERCRTAGGRLTPWTACPRETFVGLPVHACGDPQRLHFAKPELEGRFRQHPGQFLVACGLALQALGKATVTTNLMPTSAKAGVLGLLRTGLRERPVTSAWGLDLGHSSLKAIQLSADDENRLCVTQCLRISHRLNLGHPEAASSGKTILLETLRKFNSQHSVESTDRIATQWPSISSLVRLLVIPPATGKKLRELVQREVAHQIPFPLQEVIWDTFCFPEQHDGGRNPQLLLAARLRDVEERLGLFRDAEIDVQIVQCDALALHNFLHFDLLRCTTESADERRAPQGIVALDFGSDATGIVFSFPDFVWFRAVRPAGNDLVTDIARRFKVTREVAQRVVLDPTKVKRMSELHEESCVVYGKIAGQLESALSELKKFGPHEDLEQLLIAGGGAQSHGLLRFLRFGR